METPQPPAPQTNKQKRKSPRSKEGLMPKSYWDRTQTEYGPESLPRSDV